MWAACWGSRNLNTLTALNNATGQELHGFNLAPDFFAPAAGDYTLAGTSPLIDKGIILPGINDADYHGTAPDIGAFEFASKLDLSGVAKDKTINLTWQVNTTVPATTTWTISYTGPSGAPPSPITNIPSTARAYTLTNLTNYTWYTITLTLVGADPPLSDTVYLMPTDRLIYLPIIQKW